MDFSECGACDCSATSAKELSIDVVALANSATSANATSPKVRYTHIHTSAQRAAAMRLLGAFTWQQRFRVELHARTHSRHLPPACRTQAHVLLAVLPRDHEDRRAGQASDASDHLCVPSRLAPTCPRKARISSASRACRATFLRRAFFSRAGPRALRAARP